MVTLPETTFRIAASGGGNVGLVLENGSSKIRIDLEPTKLAEVVARLLAEAQTAMKNAGLSPHKEGGSAKGLHGLNPTALGITHDSQSGKIALLVHAGRSRFGIGVADPRELGQALLAASAPSATSQ